MATATRDYPPLDDLNAEFVGTAQAAFYIGFQPKTLRKWASEGGPLQPDRKINTRNRYSVAKLRAYLRGGAE